MLCEHFFSLKEPWKLTSRYKNQEEAVQLRLQKNKEYLPRSGFLPWCAKESLPSDDFQDC